MARLESTATLRESGWSLTVLREGDDLKTFTEDMLEQMREGAESRMGRALDHILAAMKRRLSRVYPAISVAGSIFTTASGTERKRKGTRRQAAPSGAPPGKITGELAESWKKKKPTWSKQKTVLTGRYFSRHPAAGALEFGSPKQGIPSHPYQRPTIAREGDTLEAILDGRLE